MTPAEFKARRERMGLSTQWLATRWGVSLLSVQRWERNRAIPDALAADFESIEDAFRDAVDTGAWAGKRVLTVPRVDAESLDGYPPAYHRAVALGIAERTGARIVYREGS